MKSIEVLDNLKNVREYILLLPVHEQIREVNRMIKYHREYNQPGVQIKKKYALINQFKDFKESLIIYHLQQLGDNPSLSNGVPPLHEMSA